MYAKLSTNSDGIRPSPEPNERSAPGARNDLEGVPQRRSAAREPRLMVWMPPPDGIECAIQVLWKPTQGRHPCQRLAYWLPRSPRRQRGLAFALRSSGAKRAGRPVNWSCFRNDIRYLLERSSVVTAQSARRSSSSSAMACVRPQSQSARRTGSRLRPRSVTE